MQVPIQIHRSQGSDLDALSDDPDELSNELSALAGPSAGPNGGQIYIDGFTGGTLPPSPRSARFASTRIRFRRSSTVSVTAHRDPHQARNRRAARPGFLQGNDSAFNTGNPFAPPPAYHAIQYNGTISGAINKNASFFLSVEGRDNPDASISTVYIPVQSANSSCAATAATGPFIFRCTGGLRHLQPSQRIEVSPRIDLQLGQKNTLTVRYQYESGSTSGNFGSAALPSQATGNTTAEQAVQMDDTQIVTDRIVNETRFQYRRASTVNTAISSAPTVSVPGYFSGGGAGSQMSSDRSRTSNCRTSPP